MGNVLVTRLRLMKPDALVVFTNNEYERAHLLKPLLSLYIYADIEAMTIT